MILYCDYCGTVFGADIEGDKAPDRCFCSPVCEHLFGSGPTLPPELGSMPAAELEDYHDRNEAEYRAELAEAVEDAEAYR